MRHDQTHQTGLEIEMNNATIILVIGVLYACIITPWYHGLWIGLLVALIICGLIDFAALAIRKIFTNR